ncbi:MAG: DUF2306 domain-containing protein [Micropepsaceae bacterium]
MTDTVVPCRNPSPAADKALAASATLWFAVALVGQWLFLVFIAGFYGPSTLTGNFHDWNRNPMLPNGYIEGNTFGNLAFASHVILAAIIAFGGVLQLIPQIRRRAPAFHRWNGRIFMVTALGACISGVMINISHGKLSPPTTINAVLAFAFLVLAWRAIRRRDVATHRRWALRSFLVVNGVFFIRVGLFGSILLTGEFNKAFADVWAYGSYLVPLALLELYFLAQRKGSPRVKMAAAAGLTVIAGLTAVGVLAVQMIVWAPLL